PHADRTPTRFATRKTPPMSSPSIASPSFAHSKPWARAATALLLSFALLVSIGVPNANASLRFSDVAESNVFSGDIDWLASRGVTAGCTPPDNPRFCPNDNVTRGQMAAFLVRALDLEAGDASFDDTAGSVFERDVAALASAGITRGCNPPDNT